jgi:hypothetical protein
VCNDSHAAFQKILRNGSALRVRKILQPLETLFADEYNRTVFQMGPHDRVALELNFALIRCAEDKDSPQIVWESYVGGQGSSYTLTLNAREAIAFALEDIGLARTDEVLILTTSGSPYISRCVTDTISRFCRWSRKPNAGTKAIFLIHEFGFPGSLPPELVGTGLPIIEDCAYALGSQNPQRTVGLIGDYAVYSFSKALPMAFGGLLRAPGPPARPSALTARAARSLPVLLTHHLVSLAESCRQRRRVFEDYSLRFAAEGLRPLFESGPAAVPHSFVVAVTDQERAERMRPKLQDAGIISSVFYGGGGYYLPNHQSMSDAAVEYVVANFMKAWRES